MSQRSIELTVGIFVLAGIIALAMISVRLGGLDLFPAGTYNFTAKFTSVSGLRVGASVEIAGVKVGRIQAIGLSGEDALVTLQLDDSIKLSKDSIASIRTKGILGDKYIRLSLGGSSAMIRPGGKIRETEPPIDIEKLIGDFIFGKVK
ncbi:MAG: outer membrane lipid asymmetry maintenance protein MlaD [Nitrospinota bacterium]